MYSSFFINYSVTPSFCLVSTVINSRINHVVSGIGVPLCTTSVLWLQVLPLHSCLHYSWGWTTSCWWVSRLPGHRAGVSSTSGTTNRQRRQPGQAAAPRSLLRGRHGSTAIGHLRDGDPGFAKVERWACWVQIQGRHGTTWDGHGFT